MSEPKRQYPDGTQVFLVYPEHCVPPADTDDYDVLLVEWTERDALHADAHGAIYRYTFKNGAAQDEQFVGLTKQARKV